MTIQEIRKLLENKQFNSAYQAYKEIFALYPDDPRLRSDMAWCLKRWAEDTVARGDVNQFIGIIAELPSLRLEMIGLGSMANRFSWDIKKLFESLKYQPEMLLYAADRLFEILPGIKFKKPDKSYTLIADSYLKIKDGQGRVWSKFPEFMDWFGFDNIMPEDYEKIPIGPGKSIPSIAERLHTNYYKTLRARIEAGNIEHDRIDAFIDRLTHLNENHQYQYTLYHKTLLLLAIGRREEALESLRPFVRRKQSEFWVWDVLADISDDTETQMSCCCRALTCGAEQKFLGKVHIKTAKLMHALGHDNNARFEIEELMKTYQELNWNIPAEAREIAESEWYENAVAPESNKAFYLGHLEKSEEFLFFEIPEIPILITFFNKEKQMCSFVTADRKRGFFSTKKKKCKFKDNGVLLVRFDGGIEENKPSKVISCKPAASIDPYLGKFFIRFHGMLRFGRGKNFGFVDDVYVNPKLTGPFSDFTVVTGTAALSYNSKKDNWGWTAIEIHSDNG